MRVEFFGVRGSTPTPGKHTLLFGGNTSCVYISLASGEDVILDSGTGIVALGNRLADVNSEINILLTHNHWDHIQGFPFFRPIYQPDRKITIIPGAIDGADKDAILTQMSGSNHPIKYPQLPSNICLLADKSLANSFEIPGFIINTQRLNHPDGGSAYCLLASGKKVAYVTDNELSSPNQMHTSWQQWLDFIADADMLIHDAQYIDADLPVKSGWGHSTFSEVAKLACQGKVKSLYIISHDPTRSDDELLAIEQQLQTQYQGQLNIYCAREGTVVDLAKS
ncbi:Ribonuclease BN, tRNA processing enzyme [Colwellia chukchiensis]|uniref:Ribonuclease BN, tRNA processing enzyme n=1 Tax=Colwellia chukchiensis TaxID=641665 RepID=A0A1H7RZS9_9GAMM|nr:MBL fold metallo-hydrolase [Colwellia chukchiensis]SEL65831.1 Ribonuclease BN, tRNA processing enzyme [Colwellia chukchiensis]